MNSCSIGTMYLQMCFGMCCHVADNTVKRAVKELLAYYMSIFSRCIWASGKFCLTSGFWIKKFIHQRKLSKDKWHSGDSILMLLLKNIKTPVKITHSSCKVIRLKPARYSEFLYFVNHIERWVCCALAWAELWFISATGFTVVAQTLQFPSWASKCYSHSTRQTTLISPLR
jgi:hypothetical protein